MYYVSGLLQPLRNAHVFVVRLKVGHSTPKHTVSYFQPSLFQIVSDLLEQIAYRHF